MKRLEVKGLKGFSFGLIVVLGLAAFMYTGEVPPSSEVGNVLFFVSVALGFSLGLMLRRHRESQGLFSLALLPLPIAVLIVAMFFAFPDYRYSEVFGYAYVHGTGPVLLVSSFLSSFLLPFLFSVRRNDGFMAADAIERQVEICNECGEKLRRTWQACPYCGAQIERHGPELRRVCPSCRKVVERKWVRCPYCGASLNTAEEPRKRVCPNCGKATNPEWKKCPYCASSL